MNCHSFCISWRTHSFVSNKITSVLQSILRTICDIYLGIFAIWERVWTTHTHTHRALIIVSLCSAEQTQKVWWTVDGLVVCVCMCAYVNARTHSHSYSCAALELVSQSETRRRRGTNDARWTHVRVCVNIRTIFEPYGIYNTHKYIHFSPKCSHLFPIGWCVRSSVCEPVLGCDRPQITCARARSSCTKEWIPIHIAAMRAGAVQCVWVCVRARAREKCAQFEENTDRNPQRIFHTLGAHASSRPCAFTHTDTHKRH